ncbi:leucine-rich repeat flightless-interacting protein 1 isoform X8 [Mustela putorius furo]|uniref:Leucine-rich repeat flightless-interacting protein 1 isoform X8 n=1 Tax=Mustela putorius furo TaxID=9669 RepID=A0A8U0MIV5_MUSPF|nr:leucine-rich repeat flightless-interacting protein 1 isoform X8 [Mustela putorius furo]
MDMGTQGSGRKRLPNRERLTAEDDALNQIAREAEARLAAKRAARAEAREIRMKELERQQKEIYQVQKKYYGLDTKWGDIEQWMEDTERYSRRSRRNTSASDEDERMSVGSRGSLRSQPDLEYGGPYAWTNGYDGDVYGSQTLNRRSGRNSSYSGEGRFSTLSSPREDTLGFSCSDLGLPSAGLAPKPLSTQSGNRPSYPYSAARPAGSYRASVFNESSLLGGTRRGSACGSYAPSEHGGHLNSSSRASSRASSARASPVVEERPEKEFTEKGSRGLPSLSAATLASLGGTSSRRGSGDTSISVDTEASIREIKELNELKDQIQDVEGKYMQGLKEMKDSLAEVEEKYKKAMVSNAQLDNEKTNFLYQVDTLKDMLLELEEQLAESRRQYDEKNKEFEREKHAHSILQFQFAEVKEALKQREELLEKHGIVLNSEPVTNGETSDTLNNVGHQVPSKLTKEELNALKTAGDGTLGRASEVEVQSEIVENVGKKEILQNTERERHKEDPAQECVGTEVFHPGENAEDHKASEDGAPSPGALADATNEEKAQNQILENASLLENTKQVESDEVRNTPGDRTGASLEQSECLHVLGGEAPDPGTGQDSYDALDIKIHSKESAENQEDLNANLGEGSTKLCAESNCLQSSEAGGLGSAHTGQEDGSPMEGVVEAGLMGPGEQVSTEASGPPTSSHDNVNFDEQRATKASTELDPSTGRDLDKEFSEQEAAEPQELPGQSTAVDGGQDKKEDGERGLRDEEPTQTELQSVAYCPEARSSPQGATGLAVADAESEPLDRKDTEEERNDQQGEALDSSQKKTKNKKKKNKKKKTTAPVETLNEVEKQLTFQDSDLSEVKEDEPVALTDRKPAVEAPDEVIESPEEESVAGSSENPDCPENPKIELNETLNQEDNGVKAKGGKETADGDTSALGDDTTPSLGTSARDKELEEAMIKDSAKNDGAAHRGPPEPRSGGASSSTLLEGEDSEDAPQTGSTEQHEMAEGPSQRVKKVAENDDLAPSMELGVCTSEGRDEPRGESEKGRSKEDCTMS